MTDTERNSLKEALAKERRRLEKSLTNVATKDPQALDSLHWDAKYPQMSDEEDRGSSAMEENADEVEEYEINVESGETLESRLRDVTHALEKIDGDEYGMCEQCKNEIPLERLKANPAARFDMEHSGQN